MRLTTRYRPDDLESVWSTLHEAGHGLYAHGIADSLMRTPLGGAPSLGDQRVAEPHLGEPRRPQPAVLDVSGTSRCRRRSREQLGDVDLDAFVRAINRAEPGLIRVDADETTYSLHIILRFELEQELIDGTVALEDLPEIWNARMKEFLGVDVPSDSDGVLQDVHWSGGGIGYFPTYALGNVISLQIWAKVREALPDLDDADGGRRPARALDWLRDNLYCLRPQADAEGDARAPDRVGRDRPAAVPRLPRRQDGRARRLDSARGRPRASAAGSSTTSPSASSPSCPPGAVLFDAHTHLGDDIDGMRGRPDEMLAMFDRVGIAGRSRSASTSPTACRRSPRRTTARSRTPREQPDRIVPFVRLDLDERPIEEATALPRPRRPRDQAPSARAEVLAR